MSLMRSKDNVPSLVNFFNDFFTNDWMDWSSRNYSRTNTSLPAVNIAEDKDCFLVEMAAPGLQKSDFNIEVNNNLMTISCEKKEVNEDKENGETYTRREFSYQSFTRSFTLPESVDCDKISANYEKGILHVSIPKKEEAKPKPIRSISIN